MNDLKLKKCSGIDRAGSAGDPDWFDQADKQMSDLFLTLSQIDDPSCDEAWDELEAALSNAKRRKS